MSAIESKKIAVENIKAKVDNSEILIFCDYRGTSVAKITDLRKNLFIADAQLEIFKNTLTRRALAEKEISYPENLLQNPTAIVSTNVDSVKIAKLIKEFSEKSGSFEIKGGVLDKKHIAAPEVKELASLPGKEQLLAKFVGSVNSPINQLVSTISSPYRGLVYILNSIKEKKEEEKK
ncbi:50S ribosomal protein L10 [Candidatus Margulisiibacteriota bacterium]